MRKVRPQRQRHFLGDDLTPEIDPAPGILPRPDAPALKGPLAVKGVAAQAVDHISRGKHGFIPRFHVGRAVRKEIGPAPQVQRVPGHIARPRRLLLRHDPGRQEVPALLKGAGRVGQPVLARGHPPGQHALRAVNLALRNRVPHPQPEMRSRLRADADRVPGLPHMVQAQHRLLRVGCPAQLSSRFGPHRDFHPAPTFFLLRCSAAFTVCPRPPPEPPSHR